MGWVSHGPAPYHYLHINRVWPCHAGPSRIQVLSCISNQGRPRPRFSSSFLQRKRLRCNSPQRPWVSSPPLQRAPLTWLTWLTASVPRRQRGTGEGHGQGESRPGKPCFPWQAQQAMPIAAGSVGQQTRRGPRLDCNCSLAHNTSASSRAFDACTHACLKGRAEAPRLCQDQCVCAGSGGRVPTCLAATRAWAQPRAHPLPAVPVHLQARGSPSAGRRSQPRPKGGPKAAAAARRHAWTGNSGGLRSHAATTTAARTLSGAGGAAEAEEGALPQTPESHVQASTQPQRLLQLQVSRASQHSLDRPPAFRSTTTRAGTMPAHAWARSHALPESPLHASSLLLHCRNCRPSCSRSCCATSSRATSRRCVRRAPGAAPPSARTWPRCACISAAAATCTRRTPRATARSNAGWARRLSASQRSRS